MAARDLHPPVETGAALAVAAGVLYLACVVLVVASPALAVRVLALLVHGVAVARLTAGAPPLEALDVAVGLVVWMALAFVFGAIYAACRNAFARRGSRPTSAA